MKRLIVLLFMALLILSVAYAIDKKKTTDLVGFEARVPDTPNGFYQTADSVYVQVVFHGTTNSGLCLAGWYNAGDAEADSNGGLLAWWDQISDIDADSGAGLYTVSGRFYDASLGTDAYRYLAFYLGGSADSSTLKTLLDDQLTGLVDATDIDSIVRAALTDTEDTLFISLDSAIALLVSYGWKLGIVDGSHSTYNVNAARDTNYVISPDGSDTARFIRIHLTGTAGGRPDSTRTED